MSGDQEKVRREVPEYHQPAGKLISKMGGKMQHPQLSRVLLAVLLVTGWAISDARALEIQSVGLYTLTSVKHFDGLDQQAIFIRFELPWERSLGQRLKLSTAFTVTGGAVSQDSVSTIFASAGPSARLSMPFRYSGWFVEFGTSPTYLRDSTFVVGELGGSLQFTSSIAVGGQVGKKNQLALSARLQHISNAGIQNPNPGVDLLGAQLTYSF